LYPVTALRVADPLAEEGCQSDNKLLILIDHKSVSQQVKTQILFDGEDPSITYAPCHLLSPPRKVVFL
jgi:hypothetical protein